MITTPEPLECWITLNEKGRITSASKHMPHPVGNATMIPVREVTPQDEQDRQEDIEFRLWKQDRAEKQKKRGDYWLTKEGRAELKECFTDPNDGNAVRPLLDALEKLEEKINDLKLEEIEVHVTNFGKELAGRLADE